MRLRDNTTLGDEPEVNISETQSLFARPAEGVLPGGASVCARCDRLLRPSVVKLNINVVKHRTRGDPGAILGGSRVVLARFGAILT